MFDLAGIVGNLVVLLPFYFKDCMSIYRNLALVHTLALAQKVLTT